MPSTSKKQASFMAICAHPESRSRSTAKCPPMKVAREFNQADKGGKLLSAAARDAARNRKTKRKPGNHKAR